jgi:hypothetical protein
MYKIIQIPKDAADSFEQLGTKYKFWYLDKSYGLTLFKEGRPGTGENWAEKIACELAGLLGIPHAQYEFAIYQDKEGVVSPTLVDRGARLIHGNELLTTFETDYETSQSKTYQQRDHTIRRVLSYFRASADLLGAPYGFNKTKNLVSALDVFIGYLMFDTWIANQDRHNENWALLRANDGRNFLSPSYDHGSSLGRNETDEKREIIMTTKDKGRDINKYIMKARSALYPVDVKHSVKALTTIEAFEQAARQSPEAAQEWKKRLSLINSNQVEEIIYNIPCHLMTDVAKRFTLQILNLNRQRILDCEILK